MEESKEFCIIIVALFDTTAVNRFTWSCTFWRFKCCVHCFNNFFDNCWKILQYLNAELSTKILTLLRDVIYHNVAKQSAALETRCMLSSDNKAMISGIESKNLSGWIAPKRRAIKSTAMTFVCLFTAGYMLWVIFL